MLKLRVRFRSLLRDVSGNALVLATLTLPAGIGLCGLGLDSIQWTLAQRQLQRQADSAALSGAYAKAQGSSWSAAAQSSLTRDAQVTLSQPATVESAPTTGSHAGNAAAVRVALQASMPLPFSSFFLDEPPLIRAEATAASLTNGTYCIISLEHTGTVGITLQGNTNVDLGCGMATNSRASVAVTTGGSSYVTASHIAAVGGLKSSVNYAAGTVLLPYTAPQKDPFAALPDPALPSCSASLNVQPNNTRHVGNPSGVACYRGMNLKGTVSFDPGIYYIDGSTFSVSSQATVTGDNVVFILTSATAATNPSSIATLDINGGATIRLSARTEGTYKGVLFYQDRRAPLATGNKVNGNAFSFLQGAIYLPKQGVSFSGTAGMNTDCVQIVARRVVFTGNSEVINECPADSGAGAFVGTRVFLVA